MTAVDPLGVGDELADEGAWFPVEPADTAGRVRRAAARLAEHVGLSPARAADWAIVVAEITSNLIKHADRGVALLRPARHDGVAGVELIAVDSGPGIPDLRLSARDGHSTAGTLGVGLGAISRLAGWHDAYSRPGQGTVLVVQSWPAGAPPGGTPGRPGPGWAGGVIRPLPGEQVSGDGYAVRVIDGRHQVMVSDGLGHGPLAASATRAAVNAFARAPAAGPAAVVEYLHQQMRHTRGAAVAVAELAGDSVVYCGLGNIAGCVVDGPTRRGMVSLPGIAGHQRRGVREYRYELPPDGVVVMHSDGVRDRWKPADYPGLFQRSPQVVASVLLRDAGQRRDDACVAMARLPR